jgi:hypothetical protein
MLIKKVYITVGITFIVWLIAAFTIFNETFLLWVFIYTALALIGSLIAYFTRRSKNNKQ